MIYRKILLSKGKTNKMMIEVYQHIDSITTVNSSVNIFVLQLLNKVMDCQ